MSLSWNEIRDRAIRLARDWKDVESEKSEKQTFWNEFFEVFGIKRRSVATFEEPVRNIRGKYGFIDLFWRGMVLVEHKSKGKSLDGASSQAFEYIQDLAREGRTNEIPRYVIVSDFQRIALHDLEPEEQRDLPLFDSRPYSTLEFDLSEFPKKAKAFSFLRGEKPVKVNPEDPANEKAYKRMTGLHDALEAGGFQGHELERFLVRVLFCLFAEDTGIFDQPGIFEAYIRNHTREDGSDMGAQLNRLWDVLNTAENRRQATLDEDLAQFPYVNGRLFEERLGFADFNRAMRDSLLTCCEFHWAKISPAVFGSLFQGIMLPAERRQKGGHYTSERDIMKLIKSLFLDSLEAELATIKVDRSSRKKARLEEFQQKLRGLKFLDPACGCGNFLVITYRELRRMELEVLLELHGREARQSVLNVREFCLVDVDQFYGIELEEWPALIAEVGLWLMDHQMNVAVADAFGQRFTRLPLKKSPHIKNENALRYDWAELIAKTECSYILGNPPFIGAKYQTPAQKSDMVLVCDGVKNFGLLDYVCGWYLKAAKYIEGTNIAVAFVSTSSITQGEQAGTLFNHLYSRYHLKINFGHRTFQWESEARGKAHVAVVIIGFANHEITPHRLYEYDGKGKDQTWTVSTVSNISPYLIEGKDWALENREQPISDGIPEMGIGNKPIDGGHYLFTTQQKAEFLELEPEAKAYFRRWIGTDEYFGKLERWCLWLGDCPPDELRAMPECKKRVEAVRDYRLASRSPSTNKLAQTPTRFHVENMPTKTFLLVPEVSSEKRRYIPMGFMSPDVMASNLVKIIAEGTLYHLGILHSQMHMAWVRIVGGRLESRYRYSIGIIYNNYPWPKNVSEKNKAAVEEAMRAVLEARASHMPPNGKATLEDLYDPDAMPADLVKAHTKLDRAVDRCYDGEIQGDRKRVEYLFKLYEAITTPLAPAAAPAKTKRGKTKKAVKA